MYSLNVEIIEGEATGDLSDHCYANAYYYPAGSSLQCLSRVMPILIYLGLHPLKRLNVRAAVELLQLTGAEVIKDDRYDAKERNITLKNKLEDQNSKGLISISSYEIGETREASNFNIFIYPDFNIFHFGCFSGRELIEPSSGLNPTDPIPFGDLFFMDIERAQEFYGYLHNVSNLFEDYIYTSKYAYRLFY